MVAFELAGSFKAPSHHVPFLSQSTDMLALVDPSWCGCFILRSTYWLDGGYQTLLIIETDCSLQILGG
jgi:hypothetical protein